MAVGQTTFTVANGAVLQLHAGGNMADYLSGDPDATAFRYTSVRFTSFGMAWFFENFDKGAASYLGETLTYTASRNCDIHEMTLFRYELPGIGNFQTYIDGAPTQVVADGTNTSNAAGQVYEVLHEDLCPAYQKLVSDIVVYADLHLSMKTNTSTSTDANVTTTDLQISQENFYREARSSCIAERYFTTSDTSNFARQSQGQPHYTDGVALAAVKSVEYKVGGQRMDRHDKYALYTWILLNSGSIGVPFDMCGLAQSTSNSNLELKAASMTFQVKYCPLIFSFCRAPSMGAPLISNMYNNLIIEAEFEAFSALICNYSGAGLNGALGTTTVKPTAALAADGSRDALNDKRTYPSASHKSFGGATIGAVPADTVFYTKKRYLEDTLANSYVRGRDLRTGRDLPGVSPATSAAISSSDLAQTDFPVSVVSRVFFLGPEERTAFASNSFSQTVEACQRLVHSTTQATSKTYRTDTFQNASSVMYVVPVYKPNKAANDYFSMGGAYDLVRNQTWPAISNIELSTNGATLYAQSDESFYRQVQAYAHHSNVLDPGRRVYALNFGTRANSRGPVQAIGYLNFSRTTNSQVTIQHATNMWVAKSSDELRGTSDSAGVRGNLAASSSTQLDIEFILWNYNLLTYKGGIAGYRYTQSNNSL
jgi:hypothetical protein